MRTARTQGNGVTALARQSWGLPGRGVGEDAVTQHLRTGVEDELLPPAEQASGSPCGNGSSARMTSVLVIVISTLVS